MARFLRYLPKPMRQSVFLTYALATRAMTLGVRAIVRDDDGNVLLLRHTYVKGWHFPGGGVERGETFRKALEKELAEEAMIALTGEPRLFHIYRNTLTSRFDHVALYVCDEWESIGEKKPDFEIAEIGFFPPDDLPWGTTAATRQRLNELLCDLPVTDLW